MHTLTRRSQSKAREALRGLCLPGSAGRSNAVLSPYFQRKTTREEAPGRDTKSSLLPMGKVFIEAIGPDSSTQEQLVATFTNAGGTGGPFFL